MLSQRRPLQALPIHGMDFGQITPMGLADDLMKKPLKMSANRSNVVSSKPKSSSRHDGSATKTSANRSRPHQNQNSGVPFTIFEDDPQPPKTVIKKYSSRKVSSTSSRETARGSNPSDHAAVTPKNSHKFEIYHDQENVESPPVKGKEDSWKVLAEERREALDVALQENKLLYEMLESYKQQNEALTKAVEKAGFIETLLEDFVAKEQPEIRHMGIQTDCTIWTGSH